MISDLIRELPCSVSIKCSKPSCFNILAGGRFFECVHVCNEVCHRLFRARRQSLLEKSVMNDRIHFLDIHADSFECYRKFHLRSLCLLKFFFSGFEDSEHILTPYQFTFRLVRRSGSGKQSPAIRADDGDWSEKRASQIRPRPFLRTPS